MAEQQMTPHQALSFLCSAIRCGEVFDGHHNQAAEIIRSALSHAEGDAQPTATEALAFVAQAGDAISSLHLAKFEECINTIRAALSHAEGEAQPVAKVIADKVGPTLDWCAPFGSERPAVGTLLYTHPAPQAADIDAIAEMEAGWRSGYPEYDGDGGVCHIPLDGYPDFMVVAFNGDGKLVDSCGDDVGYSLEDVERWRPIDARPRAGKEGE